MISPVILSVIFLLVTLCLLLCWARFILSVSDEDDEEIINSLRKQIALFASKPSQSLSIMDKEFAEESNYLSENNLSEKEFYLEKKSGKSGNGSYKLSSSKSSLNITKRASTFPLKEEKENIENSENESDKSGKKSNEKSPKSLPSDKTGKAEDSCQHHIKIKSKTSSSFLKEKSSEFQKSKSSEKCSEYITTVSDFKTCSSDSDVGSSNIISKRRKFRSPAKKMITESNICDAPHENFQLRRKKKTGVVQKNSSSSFTSFEGTEPHKIHKSRSRYKRSNISELVYYVTQNQPKSQSSDRASTKQQRSFHKSSSDESFFQKRKSPEKITEDKLPKEHEKPKKKIRFSSSTEKREEELKNQKEHQICPSASFLWICDNNPPKKSKGVKRKKGSPIQHSTTTKNEFFFKNCIKDILQNPVTLKAKARDSKIRKPFRRFKKDSKKEGEPNNAKNEANPSTNPFLNKKIDKPPIPEITISKPPQEQKNEAPNSKTFQEDSSKNKNIPQIRGQNKHSALECTNIYGPRICDKESNSFQCFEKLLGPSKTSEFENAKEVEAKEKNTYSNVESKLNTSEALKDTKMSQNDTPPGSNRCFCKSRTLNNLLYNVSRINCESDVITKKTNITPRARSRSYDRLKTKEAESLKCDTKSDNKANIILSNVAHNLSLPNKYALSKELTSTKIPVKKDKGIEVKKSCSSDKVVDRNFTSQSVNTLIECHSGCTQTIDMVVSPSINKELSYEKPDESTKHISIENNFSGSCNQNSGNMLPGNLNLIMPKLNLIDVSNSFQQSKHFMDELVDQTRVLLCISKDTNTEHEKKDGSESMAVVKKIETNEASLASLPNVTSPLSGCSNIALANSIAVSIASALEDKEETSIPEFRGQMPTFKEDKKEDLKSAGEMKRQNETSVLNISYPKDLLANWNQELRYCHCGPCDSNLFPGDICSNYEFNNSRSPEPAIQLSPGSLRKPGVIIRSKSPCNIPVRVEEFRSSSPVKICNYSRRSPSPNALRSRQAPRSQSPANMIPPPVINQQKNETSRSRSHSPHQVPVLQETGCSTSNSIYSQCTQTVNSTNDSPGKTRWIVNPELKKYQNYDYSFPRERWGSNLSSSMQNPPFYQNSDFYNPSPYLTRSPNPPSHLGNVREENFTRWFMQSREMGPRPDR